MRIPDDTNRLAQIARGKAADKRFEIRFADGALIGQTSKIPRRRELRGTRPLAMRDQGAPSKHIRSDDESGVREMAKRVRRRHFPTGRHVPPNRTDRIQRTSDVVEQT